MASIWKIPQKSNDPNMLTKHLWNIDLDTLDSFIMNRDRIRPDGFDEFVVKRQEQTHNSVLYEITHLAYGLIGSIELIRKPDGVEMWWTEKQFIRGDEGKSISLFEDFVMHCLFREIEQEEFWKAGLIKAEQPTNFTTKNRPGRPPLTEEEKKARKKIVQEAERLRKRGKSIKQICLELDVRPRTLSDWRKL
jgi:hypothetical protein